MSIVNPRSKEYETHDGLTVARNVAWVIRTLWGGVVVIALAAAWMTSLAADVKANGEKLSAAATQEQLATVVSTLARIEGKIDDGDKRQREMKTAIDKLETQVAAVEKRDE